MNFNFLSRLFHQLSYFVGIYTFSLIHIEKVFVFLDDILIDHMLYFRFEFGTDLFSRFYIKLYCTYFHFIFIGGSLTTTYTTILQLLLSLISLITYYSRLRRSILISSKCNSKSPLLLKKAPF